MVRNFCHSKDKWIPGSVVGSLGLVLYKVQVNTKEAWCHCFKFVPHISKIIPA